MSKTRTLHLEEESLMQYVDGELKRQEALEVQEHLEACWRCRAALSDLQQTITDYVTCLDETNRLIPDPPLPWNGFHSELNRLAAAHQLPWWRRSGGNLVGFLSSPRIRFASVAATVLLAATLTVFELSRPVKAAELLSLAAAHESSTLASRRGILIRTTHQSFTRPAVLAAGAAVDPHTDMRDLFHSAEYSWDNPLSAVSFTAWHDRLPERSDNVDEVETGTGLKVFRIRTTAPSSLLEEATLSFRTDNYGMVSGAFRFKGSPWIEMEMASEPVEAMAPASSERSPRPVARPVSPPATPLTANSKAPPEPDPSASSLSVRELRVFAALRDIGADLGEQIDLTQNDSGPLVVSATGLPPDRRDLLQRSLAAIPGVAVRFIQPTLARSSESPGPARGPDTTIAPTALQLRLQRIVGGGPALERLTDQILEASASATAHAHALRKLADRFPPQVESGFDSIDYATLRRLRTDHTDALIRSVGDIRRITQPVFLSLSVPLHAPAASAAMPATWQAATQPMLDTASRADRLLTMMVTGSGGSPPETLLPDTATAVQQLAVESTRYKLIVDAALQEGH